SYYGNYYWDDYVVVKEGGNPGNTYFGACRIGCEDFGATFDYNTNQCNCGPNQEYISEGTDWNDPSPRCGVNCNNSSDQFSCESTTDCYWDGSSCMISNCGNLNGEYECYQNGCSWDTFNYQCWSGNCSEI